MVLVQKTYRGMHGLWNRLFAIALVVGGFFIILFSAFTFRTSYGISHFGALNDEFIAHADAPPTCSTSCSSCGDSGSGGSGIDSGCSKGGCGFSGEGGCASCCGDSCSGPGGPSCSSCGGGGCGCASSHTGGFP